MRTGEGRPFLSQDPTPSTKDYLQFLRTLDVDFYIYHSIPCDNEIISMIEILEIEKMSFILGNEFYSINGPYVKSTKHGDYSEHVAERAISSDLFLG